MINKRNEKIGVSYRHYLVSVHKVKSLIQNGRVRGFDDLKIRSVLMYMTDLKGENNEEIGHYGQTLISRIINFFSPQIVNRNTHKHNQQSVSCIVPFKY